MQLLLIAQHSAGSLLTLLLGLVGSLAVGMALNPKDEGDDEGDEAAANAFREKAEKVKEGAENDEEEVVEVREDAEDDDDDKSPRAERRRARWRDNQDRATRAEAASEEARNRVSQLETQNQLFQQQLTNVLSQVNRGPYVDPADAELKQIVDNQESILAEFRARDKAGTLTPDDEKTLRQRMRDLNAAEVRVQTTRTVRQELAQSGAGRNTEGEVIKATFASKYPDIMADARASQLVQTEEKRLLIMGKPRGWATIDLAVRNTRKALGMGGDVSENVRRRFTGTRSAGGGGGGGGDATSVGLTKMDKKMMRARWPGLPEAKQAKLMAKEKLAVSRQSRSKDD